MKSLRTVWVGIGMVLLLSSVVFGFEAKKTAPVVVNGTIQQVDKNSKFVVVNDAKIYIAPHTKILDEKGNRLRKEDLKPKDHLEAEALRHNESYHANKVTVKTPKKGR